MEKNPNEEILSKRATYFQQMLELNSHSIEQRAIL